MVNVSISQKEVKILVKSIIYYAFLVETSGFVKMFIFYHQFFVDILTDKLSMLDMRYSTLLTLGERKTELNASSNERICHFFKLQLYKNLQLIFSEKFDIFKNCILSKCVWTRQGYS